MPEVPRIVHIRIPQDSIFGQTDLKLPRDQGLMTPILAIPLSIHGKEDYMAEIKNSILEQLKSFGLNPDEWTYKKPIWRNKFSLRHKEQSNIELRGRFYKNKDSQKYEVDYLALN